MADFNWLRFALFNRCKLRLFNFTGHRTLYSRPALHVAFGDQRGQVVRKTLPRWLLPHTDSQIGKDQTGSDLDERAHYFSMAPNRATPTEKPDHFFLPRRGPTVNCSLASGDAQRQGTGPGSGRGRPLSSGRGGADGATHFLEGTGSATFWVGGRGCPLSDTWEKWMAPNSPPNSP